MVQITQTNVVKVPIGALELAHERTGGVFQLAGHLEGFGLKSHQVELNGHETNNNKT
jgi:hypothetical protein